MDEVKQLLPITTFKLPEYLPPMAWIASFRPAVYRWCLDEDGEMKIMGTGMPREEQLGMSALADTLLFSGQRPDGGTVWVWDVVDLCWHRVVSGNLNQATGTGTIQYLRQGRGETMDVCDGETQFCITSPGVERPERKP